MTVVQAFVLGVVQGITEFLPISSSGHLILVPELFGWETQSLAFDALVHVATLGAIFVALWSDIAHIGKAMFKIKKDDWSRLGIMILVATVPVVVVGLLFRNVIETSLRSPVVVAVSLGVWGIALYLADRRVKKHPVTSVNQVSWSSALGIGLAQAVALVPGTSRSGITMTAGLTSGLNRETAARFSFLLGIPAIALAGAAAMLDLFQGQIDIGILPLVVGFFSAFFTGILTIQFLLNLLKRSNFAVFAVYRIVLAFFIVSVLM